MSKRKEQEKTKLLDKVTMLDQKTTDYLTKDFVFFKKIREQKRSKFVIKKIEAWQKHLLLDLNLDSCNERLETKYGFLYELLLSLPKPFLDIVIRDMQDDLNDISAKVDNEFQKRFEENNKLDSNGMIVASFVQNKRQHYYDKVFKKSLSMDQLKMNNPLYKTNQKEICENIVKFVAITQATVDLGYYTHDLYHTWGKWFAESSFTLDHFKTLLKQINNDIQKRGIPTKQNMVGLEYTKNVKDTRRAIENQKLLKGGNNP